MSEEKQFTPWIQGTLNMDFEYRRNKTHLVHVYQTPPLRASRPLYRSFNNYVTVYIVETSGGFVAGDVNQLQVNLSDKADVQVIQQSHVKVYPSIKGRHSHQVTNVTLEGDSRLQWMPEAFVPFIDANFTLKTNVDMDEESTMIWGEILAPGREQRGEVFDFESFGSKMSIRVGGRLIALDAYRLEPKRQNLKSLGMLEEAKYVASIWFVSPYAKAVDVAELQAETLNDDEVKTGITRINDGAIHCRILGKSQLKAQREMRRIQDLFTSYTQPPMVEKND